VASSAGARERSEEGERGGVSDRDDRSMDRVDLVGLDQMSCLDSGSAGLGRLGQSSWTVLFFLTISFQRLFN
jgi:hypothetical protein